MDVRKTGDDPGRGRAVGRQSAEIHHRARTRPPTARCWSSTSRPGASMPARPPASAKRLIDLARDRLGGPGHQPGPRRTVRNLRPRSRSCTMASCRSRMPIAEATLERIGLLMGGADPGHACRRRPTCAWRRIAYAHRTGQAAAAFGAVFRLVAIHRARADADCRRASSSRCSARTRFTALYYYFVDPLTRGLVAARTGDQGGAADPDRGRPVGLLPVQQLEHRRGRPVHRRRASPARSCRSCCRASRTSLTLPLMLVLGMLGGALYGAIPALLKVRFNTNEILTSLMLVYVAQLFLDWLVRGVVARSGGLSISRARSGFRESATLPEIIPSQGAAHWGFVFALVAAVLVWFMLSAHAEGFRGAGARPQPAGRALRRLQRRRHGVLRLHALRRAGRSCRHLRGLRRHRPAARVDLARLRLHRHHRRLPRAAQPARHRSPRAWCWR